MIPIKNLRKILEILEGKGKVRKACDRNYTLKSRQVMAKTKIDKSDFFYFSKSLGTIIFGMAMRTAYQPSNRHLQSLSRKTNK